MKLVYATDLHGDAAAYMALADLAIAERARAVLLGGDLFAYSRQAAPQIAFVVGPFRRFLNDLRASGIPVIAIHGNDDRIASVAYLHDMARHGLLALVGPNQTSEVVIGDRSAALAVLGYPYVPPTPFRLKEHERRDLATDRYEGPLPNFLSAPEPDGPWHVAPERFLDHLPSIEDDLQTIPRSDLPTLLLAHSPPHGLLDRTISGVEAGSRALRAWIVARQPVLSFHGHIHEAPDRCGHWAMRLGDTICINPGASAGTAIQAVVCDTTDLPASLRHTTRGKSGL